MGGTLTSRRALDRSRLVQLRVSAAGTSGPGRGLAQARCWVLRERFAALSAASPARDTSYVEVPRVDGCYGSTVFIERPSLGCVRDVGAIVVRPYLENCTVDASIFVVKLIRAHGGCLGTRSR